MLSFAISLLGVFALSCWGTRQVMRYARARDLIDPLGPRSSHAFPTPRGGGLALVLVFLGGVFWLDQNETIAGGAFIALLASGGLTAMIGFCDDHGHVPAQWRLLVHFAAAALALWALGGAPSLRLAGFLLEMGWLDNFIVLIGLVWLLNLFNFMDGLDGLAASEAVFVASAAAVLLAYQGDSGMAGVLALLAAAVLGFLYWNWPPAQIFMGDVGSGFLGICIGVLALLTLSNDSLTLSVWLILLAVFITDASMTLFRRMLRGERWFEAHCSHAYQSAMRRWGGHKTVTVGVLAIDVLWLFPWAGSALIWPENEWLCLLAAYLPVLFLAQHLGAGRSTL